MMYANALPAWLRRWYAPGALWEMPATTQKTLYLTFDDGPHTEATPLVLATLEQYQAKATFFCVGNNAEKHPEIMDQIYANGHRVANHTYHHLNGWNTDEQAYTADVLRADALLNSSLFRPPYGRISRAQWRWLRANAHANGQPWKLVMWSVLSGDFDASLSADACVQNVIRHSRNGSIVVFHDSAKALPRLQAALPAVLKHFANKGFVFQSL